MARKVQLLLLAALGGLAPVPAAVAQGSIRSAAAAPAAVPPTAPQDPLPGFPQVLATPTSLFAPAPPSPPPPPDLESPYFQVHPLLEPPQLPVPGWFADAEAIITKAHVRNDLADVVQIGSRPPDVVGPLGSAALDWNVTPKIDVGYRLPSGFGAFSLGYRGLATQGLSRLDEASGLEATKSHLDLNQLDVDYSNYEYSLWPQCDMKWWVGLRVAWVYFDTAVTDPDLAAAGGPLERRTTDYFVGVGPHAGLQLSQRLAGTGLSLVGRLDVTTTMGRITQGFAESFPPGGPGAGDLRVTSSQGAPMVNGQLGLTWTPSRWQDASFFIGYECERWWNVGRLSEIISRSQGDITDQGIVLQAAFNY